MSKKIRLFENETIA
jgi:hypothetical protein